LGPQSDKDSREDIQKVFNLFDDDQSGKISLKNLKRVAKELGETMTGWACTCRVCGGCVVTPPWLCWVLRRGGADRDD
jgi:hypothetical protein